MTSVVIGTYPPLAGRARYAGSPPFPHSSGSFLRLCPQWGTPHTSRAEEQIIGIFKQHEAWVKTADLCRGARDQAATRQRSMAGKVGGMDVSEAQRLEAMEDENRLLKPLVTELSLHGKALKAVIRKNCWRVPC